MSCLFTHEWVMGKVVNVPSHVRTVLRYRICERCGMMQRGFDTFDGNIPWETIRECTYFGAERAPLLRQPSSPLDQLAHRLGLRRSRASDGTFSSPPMRMKRCFFIHKWGRKIFDGSHFYVRTCERCGAIQRGIYDTWETMRDRTYIKSEHAQIIRKPISGLDQLTHSLGLRRSRMRDRTKSRKGSALTQS